MKQLNKFPKTSKIPSSILKNCWKHFNRKRDTSVWWWTMTSSSGIFNPIFHPFQRLHQLDLFSPLLVLFSLMDFFSLSKEEGSNFKAKTNYFLIIHTLFVTIMVCVLSMSFFLLFVLLKFDASYRKMKNIRN